MDFKLTFFIIVVFIFIYYVNTIQLIDDLKDTINIYIFNGLSILFVLILIYYSIINGFNKGIYNTFVIWCLFVIATPIPEAGLLVSVPLKKILNIELEKTQIVVSFIAFLFIIYSIKYYKHYLETNKSGKFLLTVFKYAGFSIFISSIIASIALSKIFDIFMNYLLDKEKIINNELIGYFILFIIPFVYYFYLIYNVLNRNK
mgnify:CR=1 FL=1|tara:strand:- start:193 stop:798 length:606 start_codon:yes stop_codon:yes gene_type:complete